MQQRLPGFFIVGAPKCGTSAMHDFLRQHPDIFMPPHKEIHYFGLDLVAPYRPDLDEYLQYFEGWQEETIAGETSVYYLVSASAADEIHQFNPEARIIIMLRNPVDAIYSLYHQVRFNLNEPLASFEEALAAEPDRARGVGLPGGMVKAHQLLYRRTVKYAEQVERYFRVFGRKRVHVIVYDDFRDDLSATYRRAVEFLGVNASFQPEPAVVNPSKVYRSRMIQAALNRPPRWLIASARRLVPATVLRSLSTRVARLNARTTAPAPMPAEMRAQLVAEFSPEIDRLSRLLNRDLSSWKTSRSERRPV